MKLLIVDDEPLARVGMRTIIPWHEKGFEIIGEAANVSDALELARKTPPDLALVDIVMPEKNGFELIREIQKINAGCKFIIISCRSEVEFYRQAISLGVSEYIQKGTLETEELLNVVEKVRKQIEKERLIDGFIAEAGNRQSRTFVPDFLNRVIRGDVEDGDLIASTLGSFELTLEIQMKNIELYRQAVGERIQVIEINGNDFGAQNGPFISPQMYRELYKPFHKVMNDWVHGNTSWKTFFHSCGSNIAFLDDFREAGVDILNPVQISAAGMEPEFLKKNYGDDFVFWGGAVDAQHTLPFGTADQVRREAGENISTFMAGGGYVFNNVHNIQAGVPVENILAMFQAVQEAGRYGR